MKTLLILISLSFAIKLHASDNSDLTTYSSRKEQLLSGIVEGFEKKTGKKIKVVYDSEGPLLERLRDEGQNTNADLLLTVDAGNLWKATDLGLLAPVKSKILESKLKKNLRDPQGYWFAVTRRVRGIAYNSDKISLNDLSTYENLADSKWKGKLCLRSSAKVYNQSLVAMMIERLGEEKTNSVIRGWVDNLAVKVFSDDTSLIKAIENGPCLVGIVNSYYLGNLIKEKQDYPVKMFWPNQKESGAHVNISGVGITKHSKNKKIAQEFIEWTLSAEAQKILSDVNLEFPVIEIPTKSLHPILQSFGKFKTENLNLSIAGSRQQQAVILMDKAGYK